MAKLNDIIIAKNLLELNYDFELQELIKDLEENPRNKACTDGLKNYVEITLGRMNNYEFALFLGNLNLGE